MSEAKHTYPPGYEPPDGPLMPAYGADAWEIMDRLPPGLLADNQRWFLSGLIAGRIETRVEEALAGKPLPQAGTLRRKPQ